MMANQRSASSLVTPMLLFSCFCLLTGDVLFGYDTGSFGGILANPGFIRQFGTYHAQTETYAFDSLHTSLLSSLSFIGKFIGCLTAGPAIERFGHRAVFFGLSIVSCIGIIIEITAVGTGAGSGRFAQFIVGRIIVYISVGLVEVDVTTYQSEIVPASFRGLVVVSLQLFLNAGTVISSGVNKAFSTRTDNLGWRTVTGIQFLFPVLITLFTWFIPSSPRWLLSKDREDDAVVALRRLRTKADAAQGNCEAEIRTIKESLQEHLHKAPWLDLVRGNNLRRTMIVIVYYFFQQTTGQAFVSTYQTTFYKTNGYAAQAFTYPIINSCLSLLSVIPAMYLVDVLGRRYSLYPNRMFTVFQPGWGFTNGTGIDRPHIMPMYNGLLIVDEMISSSGHAMIAEIENGNSALATYGVWENGKLSRMVLINSKLFAQNSMIRSALNVTLSGGCTGGNATAKRLSIPYTTATEGITWAGQSFETDSGEPTGDVIEVPLNGISITIAASEIVLISF